MRDATPDSVSPGGSSAPLGARGVPPAGPGSGIEKRSSPDPAAALAVRLADRPRILGAVLALSLVAYAAIAADVVEGGRLSARDERLSEWVAGSMPGWAEWLARVLSWLGGWVGAIAITAVVAVRLARRGAVELALLLVVVALGSQLLTTITKEGYDRPRPTAGSPIDLPTSSSFPSGHALTGMAVFTLLGLLLARELSSTRARMAAIVAGLEFGALIGASRVVLNVHFLTDVLAGAALGLAWLAVCLLVWMLVAARRRRYAEPS